MLLSGQIRIVGSIVSHPLEVRLSLVSVQQFSPLASLLVAVLTLSL